MNSTAKQIARQRVQILFQQASRNFKTNPDLSKSYLLTAKKIAMSARMRLPPVYKHRVCKNCGTLLVPGESSRVRIQSRREPHVVVTCLECGNQLRIPIKYKREDES